MLKKILGTIGSRYLIAFLNLALIFINAKVLGIEGVGMIGLIVASVNIAVIVNGILCGNTIVYFMNRYSMRTIFLPAYLWTPIGSSLACGFMYLTGLLPTGYRLDIFLLAILSSTVNANARFLLGKDNIKGFNLTFILQGGLLFFVSENGECYHSRRDCPGLKRTVQKIPKEEAFKHEVCSRCRGNNSKDR